MDRGEGETPCGTPTLPSGGVWMMEGGGGGGGGKGGEIVVVVVSGKGAPLSPLLYISLLVHILLLLLLFLHPVFL